MSDERRVVCAAIRGRNGMLMLGIRHYSRDMAEQMYRRVDGHNFELRLDEDQGFVDQHGVWMDREEAYRVAKASGQPLDESKCGRGINGPRLYSEALY